MLNVLGLIVVIIIVAGVLLGMRRGLPGTAFDFAGILIALVAGSFAYPVLVKPVSFFGITGIASQVFAYIVSCVCFMLLSGFLFDQVRRKIHIKPSVDRLFGGLLGILNGLILSSAFLMIAGATSASVSGRIERDIFAARLRHFLPGIYESLERAGVTLPRMISLPDSYPDEFRPQNQGVRFLRLNFARLEGSHCFKCEGPAGFVGYIHGRGIALVPKFICEKCGRTSDGCQTYEGFHMIYGTCPVELAEKGQMFDCGNWPNRTWVVPPGPCPVDGKTLDPGLRKDPVPYQ